MTQEEVAEMRRLLENIRYYEFAEGETYRRETHKRNEAHKSWALFCEKHDSEVIAMEVHKYDAGFQ
jgi:hypothetical protein